MMARPLTNRIDDHDGFKFRCPTDLQRTPTTIRRALVVGVCTADHLVGILSHVYGIPCDFVHIAALGDPAMRPPRPIEEYDLQILVVPLDHVMEPHTYFGMAYNDLPAEAARLENSVAKLTRLLDNGLRWSSAAGGMLTLVGNFLVPHINPVGRFLPRYDLRNPRFFVEQLNQRLTRMVEEVANVRILDLDEIICTYGRKYIQDDFVCSDSHGAFTTNNDFELASGSYGGSQPRIEELGRLSEYFELRTHEAYLAVCEEILLAVRAVRQLDAVKLVVIDLDDTAWRGVAAEAVESVDVLRTGWPLGFIEALMYLKRRGVLLGIISKNEETTARATWTNVYGDIFALTNFASIKINWKPKHENMEAILQDTNLLPRNVLYIDDNPVEREGVLQAFPDLRVIGANPYYLRRILLWSSELQQIHITDESGRRTEMVHDQMARENSRRQMTHAEFLHSLGIKVTVSLVRDVEHKHFTRLFELVNKTNQFNTTGRRWGHADFLKSFAAGMVGFAVEVSDKFSNYGIVCIALVSGDVIEQVVMSCRVIGMGVEAGLLSIVETAVKKAGYSSIRGLAITTDANVLSRRLFEDAGFRLDGDYWHRALETPCSMPAHLTLLE